MAEVKLETIHQVITKQKIGVYCGKITRIVGNKIESNGPLSKIGDLCEIATLTNQHVLAEVIGIEDEKVYMMPFDDIDGIGHGSIVTNLNQQLTISCSEHMIGRIIDPLGHPIDDKGPIPSTTKYGVRGTRYNPINRPRIDKPLTMGVKAIDGLLTIGQGQRMGIFAGSGVGKSTLLGMIARNVKADINVIALVGERGREVNEFIQKDLGEEGLKRSILVIATSDQSAIMRSKCALTATTIAEYFKDQGMNVLLMMDSLTRFAMAQREIGLSVGEAPIARGYTPSIYSELPKLLERAGKFKEGTITGLYTVLVEGDDTNEPISDTVRGILDGHIVLSRAIAMKNHYPAIDVLSSISRLMNDITDSSFQSKASLIRQWLAIVKENEDLVSIGAYKPGSNPALDEALKRMKQVQGFLTQGIDDRFDFETTQRMLTDITRS